MAMAFKSYARGFWTSSEQQLWNDFYFDHPQRESLQPSLTRPVRSARRALSTSQVHDYSDDSMDEGFLPADLYTEYISSARVRK